MYKRENHQERTDYHPYFYRFDADSVSEDVTSDPKVAASVIEAIHSISEFITFTPEVTDFDIESTHSV